MFYTIDIHGFNVKEAKAYLDQTLNQLPSGMREITIIHGYQSGNVLQQFVRKAYHHDRLERKLLSMNQGETIFVLYVKDKKRG